MIASYIRKNPRWIGGWIDTWNLWRTCGSGRGGWRFMSVLHSIMAKKEAYMTIIMLGMYTLDSMTPYWYSAQCSANPPVRTSHSVRVVRGTSSGASFQLFLGGDPDLRLLYPFNDRTGLSARTRWIGGKNDTLHKICSNVRKRYSGGFRFISTLSQDFHFSFFFFSFFLSFFLFPAPGGATANPVSESPPKWRLEVHHIIIIILTTAETGAWSEGCSANRRDRNDPCKLMLSDDAGSRWYTKKQYFSHSGYYADIM